MRKGLAMPQQYPNPSEISKSIANDKRRSDPTLPSDPAGFESSPSPGEGERPRRRRRVNSAEPLGTYPTP